MNQRESHCEQPIRIAHVIGKVSNGGVENVVFNYYRAIDRNRIQFDFIIDEDSPSDIPSDIIALGCRVYKTPPYSHLSAYVRELKKIFSDYQIVHSHMNTLSIFSLFAAKRAGVPVRIAHNHSTAHLREVARTLLKYVLRPFSRVYPTHYCACGEYAGRWLFGNKVFNSGRVTVIPNAIDVSKYKFNPEMRERVRQELGLVDKFVVGHVGRFMYQKNHELLVRIFADVYKRNSNAMLMLVGDGELRQDIEQLVFDLAIQNAVLFLGPRQDVHNLYQAMDVFVLPSWYEGFPVVSVEAQTAGLPCLLSDKVTKEALLRDECKIVELDINKWVSAIIEINNSKRKDGSSEIAEKGYDIIDASSVLANLYLRKIP